MVGLLRHARPATLERVIAGRTWDRDDFAYVTKLGTVTRVDGAAQQHEFVEPDATLARQHRQGLDVAFGFKVSQSGVRCYDHPRRLPET